MQRIDLKESDWRSSIAKAKAMDWLIRHRVAGKSSVEVDNYVEKLCTHSCEVESIPVPHCVKNSSFSVDPDYWCNCLWVLKKAVIGMYSWLRLSLPSSFSSHLS